MIKNVRGKDPAIFAYFAVNALSSGIEPVMAVFAMQFIVTRLTNPGRSIWSVIITITAYIVLSTILKITATQSDARSWGRICYLRMDYMKDMFGKILSMDYAYFENPNFFNENQSAFDAVSGNGVGVEGIYHRLFSLGGKLISILLISVVISLFNPLIVVVLLASVILNVFAMKRVSKYSHDKKPDINRANRRVSRLYEAGSNFEYGKDIRLFDLKGRFADVFKREIESYRQVALMIANREFSWKLVGAAGTVAAELAMYAVLTAGVLNGLPIAAFAMYMVAVTLLSGKMRETAEDIGFIRDQLLYVDDMYEFLDANLITENSDRSFSADKPLRIEFVDVSFKYPNTDRYVLKNLNLTIEPSEKLAIVGVNGGGKTTLVKLLTGLYRPTEGKILINGVDYLDMKLSDLQDLIAMVSQEVQPLALSVAENVSSLGNPDREKVEECLKQVGLLDKIKSYPKGVDTSLLRILDEEGIILSGGENQKVMIARALYKKGTQLMIMDEPTAALDALAEEKIYREMNEIMQGRTAIFISHRIASTRFCDRIVLLDGGNIKESGTHEELMAAGGLYREMFEAQAKYYRDEAGEAV